MEGLSVAAILLAVVLVVGLLAWVWRDLRARRAPMRAWWLVVGCYALAAIAWLVAITVPLPVTIAWVATIPAAVATVIPERLAAWLGGIWRPVRRRRTGLGPRPAARTAGAHRQMAHPTAEARPAPGVVRRRPILSRAPTSAREPASTSDWPHAPMPEPPPASTSESHEASTLQAQPPPTPAPRPATTSQQAAGRALPAAPRESVVTSTPPARQRHAPSFGRHHWSPGDLRLAVELLEDAARIPDLDDAARQRIEARLVRLERFHGPATDELLALVREDVHARLAAEVPTIDPDPTRARRITILLDELDPRQVVGGAGT